MSFRHNTTYINLVTEGSVGAILELALVVCGVADSEASQGCGEVPLGRTIIQTETPTATWKHREFINIYVKLDVFHTETGCDWPPSYFHSANSAYSDIFVVVLNPLKSTVIAFAFQVSSHQSNLQPLYMFYENLVLLQEAGDVLLGAGRPCEG